MLASGTGFFLDESGTFATNHHVLEGAHSLIAELSNGEQFSQIYTIVVDAERDIAILSIDPENTPAVILGEDGELEVGDPVFVMGNPLGLDRTFSNGMVSALRSIEESDVIQITAPISPGSSGGPVMNDHGHVIGIATWYLEHGQNLNMAVPIRYVGPMLAGQHVPRQFEGTTLDVLSLSADALPYPSRRRVSRIRTQNDDAWAAQVLQQLASIEDVVTRQKFTRSHQPVTGDLTEGQSAVVTMTLQQDTNYIFAAACDEDCDDLDLFLYDSEKQLLAEDKDPSDVPIFSYRSPVTTDIAVRARMYSCNQEPCTFGIAVFREK